MSKVSGRLWVALAATAFLVAAAWLAKEVIRASDSARTSACSGNLAQLVLAMHFYHDVHGAFPPAYVADENGKPMHSWRALLLPYLDGELAGKYRYHEPWDSPNNLIVGEQIPTAYFCPADPDAEREKRTNYFVIVGDETAFPGATAITLDDVTADPSSTLLIAESTTMRVHWLEPRDLSVDSMSFAVNDFDNPSVSSHH